MLSTLFKLDIRPLFRITNHFSVTTAKLKMTSASVLKPPEVVKGMQVLNKEKFVKQIDLPYVTTENSKLSEVLKSLKKYLFKVDNFKPVRNEGNNALVNLDPTKVSSWSNIDESDRESLQKLDVTEGEFNVRGHELTYENYSLEQVFRAVLPEDKEGMASFTTTGHLVHVNLRDHLLPYKSLIGQVLLDKVPRCRTVVNKLDNIDNTYRFFKMEVLAGTEDFKVTVKESNCRFEFDFSKVYWNSRLSTEHERIVKLVKPGEVLFDVFAGVGPFSVPAAKRGCVVYANDLNPESYKWLCHNAKINKVHGKINLYNKDGHDFIHTDLKDCLIRHLNKQNVHVVMNLPALAVEFVKDFFNLYNVEEVNEITKPVTLYVYCFTKGENSVELAKALLNKSTGQDMSEYITDIFKVRTVSSMKDMMRITINLDKELLLTNKRKHADVVMGKNKSKKISSVFKVAGAKSLKSKNKAKPVTTRLQNIKKNPELLDTLDQQLLRLQERVHRSEQACKSETKKKSTPARQEPTQNQKQQNFEQMQTDVKEMLENLEKVELPSTS